MRTDGKTGVEMEALTAVSVAALTIYDMVKAVDKDMVIGDICLVEKSGGRCGHYRRSTTPVTSAEYRRLALILGALTAIGPLAIDMYLPALPTIAREFGADAAAVQVSLAAYFIGIAIGQAFYGPLSDALRPQAGALLRPRRLHRRRRSAARGPRAFAALVAFRFLQALGGCAPLVIPRAVVRDYFDSADRSGCCRC